MDWWWQELLRLLLSAAVVLGVLRFVGKTTIEHWLSGRLEKLRQELRIAEAQRSRLLARQATIVAGVFARLERLHEALRRLSAPVLHGGPAGAVPLKDAAVERFDEFVTYYYERAIWLDPATCDQLNALVELLKKLLMQMDYNLDASGQVKDRKQWIETYERLQKDVPLARGALDQQFRAILSGDTSRSSMTHRTS